MVDLKHVARFIDSGRKCLVAYRTLPGDAYSCLVIPTENLPEAQHDALINIVESSAAQSANEFAEVLARQQFPDGSIMLAALHTQGKLIKVPTDAVEMIPNFSAKVRLDKLNVIIAEQRNIAVDDLAIKPPGGKSTQLSEVKEIATVNEVPPVAPEVDVTVPVEGDTPEIVAKRYRSQADKLAKEAAQFRRLAEDLVPTKKK